MLTGYISFIFNTGMCKISQNCTVTLKVLTSPEGRVTVDACYTHLGHNEDLQHTWLAKDKRDEIAAKLKQGIGLEENSGRHQRQRNR